VHGMYRGKEDKTGRKEWGGANNRPRRNENRAAVQSSVPLSTVEVQKLAVHHSLQLLMPSIYGNHGLQ
jgi:hypothetical protein